MGFGQNLGWENGIYTPLQDPHILRVYYEVTSSQKAQSVEHCTGIAEVMGSNPVQAWMFFSGLNFTTA